MGIVNDAAKFLYEAGQMEPNVYIPETGELIFGPLLIVGYSQHGLVPLTGEECEAYEVVEEHLSIGALPVLRLKRA